MDLIIRREIDLSSDGVSITKLSADEYNVSLIKGVLIGGAIASAFIFSNAASNLEILKKHLITPIQEQPIRTWEDIDKEKFLMRNYSEETSFVIAGSVSNGYFTGNILANAVQNKVKHHESKIDDADIMYREGFIEGATNMVYEQLIQKREKFENRSIIFGLVIAVISSIIPFIIDIKFSAIAPAPLSFLTISCFMGVRKFIRRMSESD